MVKIGELVKLQIPGLNGLKNVAGTIVKILPNGMVEIRTQQDGYWTIKDSDIKY